MNEIGEVAQPIDNPSETTPVIKNEAGEKKPGRISQAITRIRRALSGNKDNSPTKTDSSNTRKDAVYAEKKAADEALASLPQDLGDPTIIDRRQREEATTRVNTANEGVANVLRDNRITAERPWGPDNKPPTDENPAAQATVT